MRHCKRRTRREKCLFLFAALFGMIFPSSSVVAREVNLLKNPSFETVDAQGMAVDWSVTKLVVPGKQGEPTLVIGPPAHGREKAAKLSFGSVLEWSYVSQTHWKILSPGEQYTFSVQLRSDKPGRASIVLFAMGKHPNEGEKVLAMQRREWIDLTTEWTRYSTGATIDNVGQYVRLWCVVQLHTPDVTLSIDDARLVDLTPKSADVSDVKFAVGCVRTEAPPTLDGKLDDACWKRAGIADDFWNTENHRNEKPTQKTTTYLLYDDANLYIAFRLAESDISSIKAAVTDRDGGVWSDDCAELFLLPPDSRFPGAAVVGPQRYYHMVINSLGTQQDEIGKEPPSGWNADWQSATRIDTDAWTVEMRIALKSLDANPTAGSVWKVNFNRSEKRLEENSSWARMKIAFHDPERFGHMFFVDEPGDAALVMAKAIDSQAVTIRRAWMDKFKPTLAILKSSDRTIAALQRRIENMSAAQVVNQRDDVQRKLDAALAQAHVRLNKRGGDDLRLYPTPVITNNRVLPTSLVVNRPQLKRIELSACRGEYESTSFVATVPRDRVGITVFCSDLLGAKGTIPQANIDIKVVKCWYQANDRAPGTGGDVSTQRGKALMPELLLNDDDLVRVDLDMRQNLLRITDAGGDTSYENVSEQNDSMSLDMIIRDAPTLQPVNIKAGHVQQFWLTVHIPDDAAAGVYGGTLGLTTGAPTTLRIPIELTVHPFDLAKPALVYSIFYRSKLGPNATPMHRRTPQQYRSEQHDLIAHGVTAPLVYQSPGDLDLLRQALELRLQAGVSTERFFFCAWSAGPKDIPEPTRKVLTNVRRLIESFGYKQFYNYGRDEPTPQQLLEYAPAYRFLHDEMNIKSYYACNALLDSTGKLRRHLWDAIKDNTAALTVGGPLNPWFAKHVTGAGMEIYSYANPQCGEEEPLTYRRNFGLALWKAGYTGAMNYAYQHGFGRHPWNDFDPVKHNYRDHMMAYPTIDGVVGTVQWEGFREGVDDVRYLSTLLDLLERDGPKAASIRQWIDSINPNGDLDQLRVQIVDKIMSLRPPPPPPE